MRGAITIFINNERHDIAPRHTFMMVANYLRQKLGLCGTKIVCAEGDCGACTVLYVQGAKDARNKKFKAINACITPMFLLDGGHIITIESLALDRQCQILQDAVRLHHGSQCGYCTPGIVMALAGFFQQTHKNLTEQKVKNCLTGNLCRCTGYQSLIDAALSLKGSAHLNLVAKFIGDEQNEQAQSVCNTPALIEKGDLSFYAPTNLKDALSYYAKNPQCRIVSGASDVGVLVNKRKCQLQNVLSLHLISQLKEINQIDDRILIGALVTFEELRQFLKGRFEALVNFINVFASLQIKNVATVVGNIANASPIADSIPVFMVIDGIAHVASQGKKRSIPIKDLFRGYKKLALNKGDLITHLSFTLPNPTQKLGFYKASQRRDLDISTVNAAFRMRLNENHRVLECAMAFGGVAPNVTRLMLVEKFLQGKELSKSILMECRKLIEEEITPISDMRGSATFRSLLAKNLFSKFIEEHCGRDLENA